MATPSTLKYGTVTGQFVTAVTDGPDADLFPENVAARGTVTFTPSTGVVLSYGTDPNPIAVLKSAIVCPLDDEGYICAPGSTNRGVNLLATDDITLQPVGWVWNVTYQLEDQNGKPLYTISDHPIQVPTDAVVNLITATPIESANGVFITKGDKGDKGDTGDTGNGIASATVTGDYLSITYTNGTVSNVGYVRGPQGAQGIQGIQGLKGDVGDMVGVAGPANVGGTINIDVSMLPSTRIWTLTSNVLLTLPIPASNVSATITLVLYQDATGGRTITWPSATVLKWTEGIQQQPAAAAGSMSIIHLMWTGTQWVGLVGGKSFA